jgi:hypothetical protein
MTEPTTFDYAAKVAALLAKAERTDSPQEAETYTAAAQRIMDKHMIDLSMLPKGTSTDELATLEIAYTGILAVAKRTLGSVVARGCGCKIVVFENKHKRPKEWVARLHGYQSDLDRAKLLDASLQIQAVRALKVWEKEKIKSGSSWMELPGFEKFKDRRSFVEAFASGVSIQLSASLRAAKEAAAQRHTAMSVEVALRDRSDSVRDYFDEMYGSSLRTSRRRHAAGSYGAQSAGYAAGRSADTNRPRVGGGRTAIDK